VTCSKDVALRRSETEVLVRDSTNNEQWGPSGSDMRQIADLTYSPTDYTEIMTTLWERLEDSGKNWRHVYKGLLVIDYLLKNGSERVVQECKFRSLAIKTLGEFQYIDEDEKDQGLSVRQRAKAIMELLNDEKRLNAERQTASKNREKFGQAISSEQGFQQSHVYARGTGRSMHSTSSADRYGGGDRYGGSPYSGSSAGPSSGGGGHMRGDESSSEEEERVARRPSKRTSAAPASGAASRKTESAPDLIGFDAFASPAPQPAGAHDDLFDPRSTSAPPQPQQQIFVAPPAASASSNRIDFFGPGAMAPPATQPVQPQQQPQQPQQQTLPGNPQRLPNGNLLVQGHEITIQQYQQYMAYVQQQTASAQQPQQPPAQTMQSPAPRPSQPQKPADDDWNDFTGSSKPATAAQPLSPTTNGAQAPRPKDKFDDLLDLSSLVSGGTPSSTAAPKSNEPTLAQLQAQRQAQAQQSAYGFSQPPAGNQWGQPQQPQNNGFFF